MSDLLPVTSAIIVATLVTPYMAAAQSIDPVHIAVLEDSLESNGNGARFHVNGGCATVTAAHVVESTTYPRLTPQRGSVGPATVDIAEERLDVGIINQRHAEPEQCGKLPTTAEVEAALRSGSVREVRFVDAGGTVTALKLDLVRYTGWDIFVRISEGQDGQVFRPGNSGALVVFDGVPVGVITDAFAGRAATNAKAIRLDSVMRNFPDQLAQPRQEAPPPRQIFTRPQVLREPYDLTQLPSDFQEIVREARLTRKRAEQAVSETRSLEGLAEDAARRSRLLPEKQVEDGVGWFRTSTGDGIYRGEITLDPSTKSLSAAGYGVKEFTQRAFLGDRLLCEYRDGEGCSNLAIYYYAFNESNTSNLMQYRGGYEGSDRMGYGYVEWRILSEMNPASSFTAKEAWMFYSDDTNARPGVWQSTSGNRYEGEVDNKWNGMGVVWSPQGQVLQIGTWKDGKTVKNVTTAWRNGTYVPGTLNRWNAE